MDPWSNCSSRKRKIRASPSTSRRRNLYQKRKEELFELLGAECEICGKTEFLTFDHKNGRDWDISAVHSTKRMRIYIEEAKQGLLRVLCLSCNSSKPEYEEPF